MSTNTDYPNLDPKHLRTFTFSTNTNHYCMSPDNGVHIIYLPLGLEAIECKSKSIQVNKHIALTKLNDQVGNTLHRQAEFSLIN